MNKDIRILLVDDHQIIRDGLRRVLELEDDMKVVGEAGNAKEAFTQVESLSPEVVLMDVKMPEMNGIEITRQLREQHFACKIIMLTLYDEYVDQAIEAGAKGYVLKSAKSKEITEAIRQVYRGQVVISETIHYEKSLTKVRTDSPHPEAPQLISEIMAGEYSAMPAEVKDNVPQVASTNSEDIITLEALVTQSMLRDTRLAEFTDSIRNIQFKEVVIREATQSQESRTRLRKDLPQLEALKLIPEEMAKKYNAIPLAVKGSILQVAVTNPEDIVTIQALAMQSQMYIEPKVATAEEIRAAIDANYQSYDDIQKQISNMSLPSEITGRQIEFDTAIDSPIARALSLIIDKAIKARASDIHFQPEEDRLRVSHRIDGVLHDMLSIPLISAIPLISRIKILADMNIAEQHRPQDGHFSIETSDHRSIDIRVGTMPTVNGEMVALRLLDKSIATKTPSELGFLPECLTQFNKILEAPYGMILISGPTGAGKTTTLYAAVNSLDLTGKNIIAIEDPVEYRFERINQTQVNTRAGLTFATGLRSIVRLDPDVVLVGEIRDAETAEIAVQSALTGHLVLSSIHANDAVGVIMRLLDLGIKPFLIASALVGVVAQRMVRKICPDCARLVDAPSMEQMVYSKEIGEERSQFLYACGCKSCAHTGYSGRTGIFEVLTISDEIRTMVLNSNSTAQLRAQAINEGMTPLIRDGMLKVKANITTPAEVLRVAYSVGD